MQNEDGVEITLRTETYLFSLFCMNNFFFWETPSSRFADVGLKIPTEAVSNKTRNYHERLFHDSKKTPGQKMNIYIEMLDVYKSLFN